METGARLASTSDGEVGASDATNAELLGHIWTQRLPTHRAQHDTLDLVWARSRRN